MKNTKELNKQKIKIKKKHVGATIGRPLLQRLDHRNGITLIALVITIVLMLILATVTVNVVIDGGLFNYAKNAKDSTEIASEKETVQKAIVIAESTSKTGRVTVSDMQKAMNTVAEESNITVIDNTDTIVVKFNNSNRYYTLNDKGNVEGPIETINDTNSGDLSKGGNYLGTEESPYVINCIEDLVVFSQNYITYESSYVILARTLDFNSIFSYNDYSTKEFGDLNGDGTVDNIKTELTKQGDQCGGFTPIASFKGTFDGQNNKICNLYENRGENNAGLFSTITRATIQNLGLQNITLIGGLCIGGIVASADIDCAIINCHVEGKSEIKCTLESGNRYGGLILARGWNTIVIEKCYSIGTISLDTTGIFGGIVGINLSGTTTKCYNVMDISSNGGTMAGIVGKNQSSTVDECYHIGDITGGDSSISAGIAGEGVNEGTIKNCYNIGDINGKRIAGGIIGFSNSDCFNCYSVGIITKNYCCGVIHGMNYGSHIVHCFGRRGDFTNLPEGELTESQILNYLSSYNNSNSWHKDKAQFGYECNVLTDEEMKLQSFVDELNTLITADSEGIITETSQTVWKMDTEGINNGYPIFVWQTEGENSQ